MADVLDRAIATTAALERVVAVLQEHYADELAAVAAVQGSPSIEAPAREHYYLPGGYPEHQLYELPVCVQVSQNGPETVGATESGTPSEGTEVILLPVRVKLMFERDAFLPLDRIGHDQTKAEHLGHLARVYYGALINTIYKRLRDGVAVSNVRVTGGDHSLAQLPEPRRAGCYLDLTITQTVCVPHAIYS